MAIVYDFNKRTEPRSWIVEGLIPANSLIPFIAKEKGGKSFFVEALAVSIIHGARFLGRETHPTDVLLIDQETPDSYLDERLKAFKKAMTKPQIRKLYQVREHVSLDDGSLIKVINKYKQAKVVIIDSLHAVCGKVDSNSTKEMFERLTDLKEVLHNGRTIILNHHVSAHKLLTVDDMMSTENSGDLSMGSSAILQQAEAYFVLGNNAESDLEKLYIRPVQKRGSIQLKPFVARFEDDKEKKTMKFVFGGNYVRKMTIPEIDVLCVLKDRLNKGREPVTVPYIFYEELNGKHNLYQVRQAVEDLLKRKRIKEYRFGARKFTYEYIPKKE